jgi:hypothetical protein
VTKPVLLAGLLGGLIGAGLGFVLSRTFPPTATPVPPPAQATSEAREFASDLIALLKDGKHDAFFAALRPGFAELNDEQFQTMRNDVLTTRQEFAKKYGSGREFEYGRESAISPSLVRVTFVEKFERSAVVYNFMMYNSPAGWRVHGFTYQSADSAFSSIR